MGKIIGCSPKKVREYILKENRDCPPEDQVIWGFRALSADGYYQIQDALVELHSDQAGDQRRTRTAIHTGSQERRVLMECFVSVKNYFDEDGTERAWPEGRGSAVTDARMEFLSTMRPAWRRELAEVILEGLPDEVDEKDLRFRSPALDGVGGAKVPEQPLALPA